MRITVGYNSVGATNKWLIIGQTDKGLTACRFSVVKRLDGTSFLSRERVEIRPDLVDIHEETINE